MYAIIRAGGKQYRVQAGETIRVEKLAKDLGETFDLTDLLMVGGDKTFSGSALKNAKVSVTVTRQAQAPKIIVFKKKRRQGYRRMHGHRQLFTELFVNSITSPEGQTTKTDTKAVIVDPLKSQERKDIHAAKTADQRPVRNRPARGPGSHDKPTNKMLAKMAAAGGKKKTAKKATKKASGKKKTAKKKTSKKK
jgi:large subunit ribosomal protein L21